MAVLKTQHQPLTNFDHGGRCRYVEGARPWVHVGAEGSNMGCTQEAIDLLEDQRRTRGRDAVWYALGKAANGGVAVSGLEMAQNSQRLAWTADEVEKKLKGIMKAALMAALETAAKYVAAAEGELPSLVAGSNIAGFVKVAQAMHEQGDW